MQTRNGATFHFQRTIESVARPLIPTPRSLNHFHFTLVIALDGSNNTFRKL
jgi:hypothetical protein